MVFACAMMASSRKTPLLSQAIAKGIVAAVKSGKHGFALTATIAALMTRKACPTRVASHVHQIDPVGWTSLTQVPIPTRTWHCSDSEGSDSPASGTLVQIVRRPRPPRSQPDRGRRARGETLLLRARPLPAVAQGPARVPGASALGRTRGVAARDGAL